MTLTLPQGTLLVTIARGAIDSAVLRSKGFNPPAEEFLRVKRGAFVTLSDTEEKLRGCIGVPYPTKPLGEAVFEAAIGAATRDPRFPTVEVEELDSLTVEVSALTPPEELKCRPADYPRNVRIGTDGLIVTGMGSAGLLLPQVATEFDASPQSFLSMTCQKAGLPENAWMSGEVAVRRFQAEVFVELAPRGAVGELKGQR